MSQRASEAWKKGAFPGVAHATGSPELGNRRGAGLLQARTFTALCFLVLQGGCVFFPERQPSEEPASPRYQVEYRGNCLDLKTGSGPAAKALLNKVEELLVQHRAASAEMLVQRNLEVAVEALRTRTRQPASVAAEQLLAQVVDAEMLHPARAGWEARREGKSDLSRLEEGLAQAAKLNRENQTQQVRDLLLSLQTKAAAYPYQSVLVNLALADAQRRLGQTREASVNWQKAAVQATLIPPMPTLWEHLAGQRPLETPWPAEVARSLGNHLPPPLHPLLQTPHFLPEALVWYVLGQTRLHQGEAPAALAAFQRADSFGKFPEWDDFLRLHQAKAFQAMGQAPAAVSMLTPLAERANSPWQLSAKAMLGSGKFHEGHTQQALVFLESALQDGVPFLGHAEATADLGLVYLSLGQETKGLALLKSARGHFTDRGLHLLSLENEIRYLEQTRQPELAAERRAEVDAVERQRRKKPY